MKLEWGQPLRNHVDGEGVRCGPPEEAQMLAQKEENGCRTGRNRCQL